MNHYVIIQYDNEKKKKNFNEKFIGKSVEAISQK